MDIHAYIYVHIYTCIYIRAYIFGPFNYHTNQLGFLFSSILSFLSFFFHTGFLPESVRLHQKSFPIHILFSSSFSILFIKRRQENLTFMTLDFFLSPFHSSLPFPLFSILFLFSSLPLSLSFSFHCC